MSLGIISQSMNFGMQNFFFLKLDEIAPSGDPYYYYGFQDKKGAILIMRTDTNTNNAKYYLTAGDFDTIFAAHSTYTYQYPVDIALPRV